MENKSKKKKRIRYSWNFKRKALLRMIRGDNPKDIFLSSEYDTKELFEADKKYASKLLYKWKQEIYKNKDMLCLINIPFTNDDIAFEIELMTNGDEEEPDEIEKILKKRRKSVLEKKLSEIKSKN